MRIFAIPTLALPTPALCAFAIAAPPLVDTVHAAPDKTQGMVVMSASVNGAGVLRGGSGAVDAERVLTGAYSVVFNRNIDFEQCIFLPFAIGEGNSARIADLQDNLILVVTIDGDGDELDTAFTLLVYCAR